MTNNNNNIFLLKLIENCWSKRLILENIILFYFINRKLQERKEKYFFSLNFMRNIFKIFCYNFYISEINIRFPSLFLLK